jgi:hypothetical protein
MQLSLPHKTVVVTNTPSKLAKLKEEIERKEAKESGRAVPHKRKRKRKEKQSTNDDAGSDDDYKASGKRAKHRTGKVSRKAVKSESSAGAAMQHSAEAQGSAPAAPAVHHEGRSSRGRTPGRLLI